jgi:serine/threonine protein kinase
MEARMTPQQFQRLRELFEQALLLAPEKRAAFLEQACGPDASLRREVEELLEAQAATQVWVDRPAVAMLAGGEGSLNGAEVEGRRIGAYTLVRLIGRGGMGAVYLAEQQIGRTRRQVALKLLRDGFADVEAFKRRFEQEREILAALDHPNIARLMEAGSTEQGQPYFVMEYVDGEPVDSFCDSRKLDVAERLKLFRTICGALEYAHGQGIVHRDLKPANVLVKTDGTVKLLDFGIAKLVNRTAGVTELLTHTGQQPMTIEYASPEQIKGEEVTAATDVYSLGVLLYEVLTGHRPYRMHGRLAHEMARVICDEPPARPSAVVTQTETCATSNGVITITPERVSDLRAERPSRLRRLLSGDLDSILLKALRKESQWRYASVRQLDEDIERHLAGLPVTARKSTWAYRFAKGLHRVINPPAGGIHHNAAMFISWGIFGATLDARRQALVSGFRRSYNDMDMLPVLVLSIALSIREGRRIRAHGPSSPGDRMVSLVLAVTVAVLWLISVLGRTTDTTPDRAIAMFWNAGLATAFLIAGIHASRVLMAGGVVLLLSVLMASLHPGWYYGWLAAGLFLGVSGAGVIFAFQSVRYSEPPPDGPPSLLR